MIPKVNQYVKIVFRNNTIVEGFVKEWSDKEVQLKSEDGESTLVITHPNEDIMLIKIMHAQPPNEIVDKKPVKASWMPEPREMRWEDEERADYSLESMRKEFKERLYAPGKAPVEDEWEEAVEAHNPNNPDDRKSLAELRVELTKQEKDIIAKKLREHLPNKNGKVEYQHPSIIFKKEPNGNS